MAPNKPDTKKMVAVRLPRELVEWIEDCAEERKMTITGVYEEALAEYLGSVCSACNQTIPANRKKKRVGEK